MNIHLLLILLYPRLCSGILGNSNLFTRGGGKEKKKRSISRKSHMLLFHLLFKLLLSQLHIDTAKNSFDDNQKSIFWFMFSP